MKLIYTILIFLPFVLSCTENYTLYSNELITTTKCKNYILTCSLKSDSLGCVRTNLTHASGCTKTRDKVCCMILDFKTGLLQSDCSFNATNFKVK